MKKAFLFVGFKLFVLLFLSLFINRLVPYGGHFPYRDVLLEYHLPAFLTNLANFDGVHYLLIGRGNYMQYEQAFFPLYPLLIKILGPLFFKNYLLAGLFISNLSFFLSLIYLSKLLKIIYPQQSSLRFSFLLFLVFYPTSFFFQALYTESLFLLLFVSSLYYLKKKNYWLAGTLAGFSSATRLVGVFLFIPFFFNLFSERKKSSHPSYLLSLISNLPFFISPFLGLFSYMVYLYLTTQDPLFFFNSQPAFGANRSTSIISLPQVYYRYFKIITTASWNTTYFISLTELLIFTFCLTICLWEFIRNYQKKNYFLFSLALFSLINLLLPTLTGTFSSLPRYSLFSFSVFFHLSALKQPSLRFFWLLFFGLLQIILYSLFSQGYFVS
jgi:Gpi18-like mannosyltransferase